MHRVKAILTALRRERKWLIAQTDIWRESERDRYRRNDLRSACVSILRDSVSDYNGWVARAKKRRQSGADATDAELIARDTRWWESHAVKALVRLIDLAESDLLACKPFRPRSRCGPLKVAISRRSGDTEQLAKGREMQAQQRAEEEAAKQARIRDRMRGNDSQAEDGSSD